VQLQPPAAASAGAPAPLARQPSGPASSPAGGPPAAGGKASAKVDSAVRLALQYHSAPLFMKQHLRMCAQPVRF